MAWRRVRRRPFKRTRTVRKRPIHRRPTGVTRRLSRLERTIRRQTRIEFFKSQAAYRMNIATVPAVSWCLNEPNTFNLLWNAGAALPNQERVYHHNTGLRLFLSTESQNVTNTYFTVFILRGKPALQRYLDGTNELAPAIGQHYTTGSAGQLTEGRTPGAMVNKDLFSIVKYKRIKMGNTAYVGQGVSNFDNTHKEFYFKFRPKTKYQAVQGNVLTLTEGQMPVTQRYFLLVVSDEAPGDQQPDVWVNWVAVHKIDCPN